MAWVGGIDGFLCQCQEILPLHPLPNVFFPLVYMKDVRSEDMEALLDFMYRGVVHLPQESLTGLLKTAEGLQVGWTLHLQFH